MSLKPWEKSQLSNTAEASALMQEHWTEGSIKARIRQAAHDLRWSFSRASDVWYRKARRVDAHEMDRLREATKKQIRELANDHQELTDRLARMEAMLSTLVSSLAGGASDRPEP